MICTLKLKVGAFVSSEEKVILLSDPSSSVTVKFNRSLMFFVANAKAK